MSFSLLLVTTFVLSLIVSPLLIALVSRLFRKWGFLDRPHLYKSEQGRKPAPYGVGVVIILMLLIFSPIITMCFDLSEILERRLHIVLILGIIIALVSFVDDMDTIGKSPISIPPIVRLLMQIGIGIFIGLTSIKISYISGAFGEIISLTDYSVAFEVMGRMVTVYYIPLVVTMLWYVVVFNAVNFSDGVPGLTGGYALIAFLIMGGLALKLMYIDTGTAARENSQFLLLILAIIIPVTFFLTRGDISRQWIMGDSGTIMLAFLIATLAIIAGGKIATAFSVLGLYLIDLIYVVTVRLMKGKNPMKGEQSTHLHFRLMEIGLTPSQIRTMVYSLTAIFGIMAIFLGTKGKIFLIILITFITVFLTQILTLVKRK